MSQQLLDHADLRARGIRYTKPHLWRLWTTGKFPKPIKLSASRNVWRADEVDEWVAQRIAARDGAAA